MLQPLCNKGGGLTYLWNSLAPDRSSMDAKAIGAIFGFWCGWMTRYAQRSVVERPINWGRHRRALNKRIESAHWASWISATTSSWEMRRFRKENLKRKDFSPFHRRDPVEFILWYRGPLYRKLWKENKNFKKLNFSEIWMENLSRTLPSLPTMYPPTSRRLKKQVGILDI